MSASITLSRVCAHHLGWDVDTESTAGFATAHHPGADLCVELHRAEVGEGWVCDLTGRGASALREASTEEGALREALVAFRDKQVEASFNEKLTVGQRVTAGLRARTIDLALATWGASLVTEVRL